MSKKKNYLIYKNQFNSLDSATYKVLTHSIWSSTTSQQKTYSSLKLKGIFVYLMKLNLIKNRFYKTDYQRFFQSSTSMLLCNEKSIFDLLSYLNKSADICHPLVVFVKEHPVNYFYLLKNLKGKAHLRSNSPQGFGLAYLFSSYSRFFRINPIWKFLLMCQIHANSKST